MLWGTVSFKTFVAGGPGAVRAEVRDRAALDREFGVVIIASDYIWPSQLSYACFTAWHEAAEQFGRDAHDKPI